MTGDELKSFLKELGWRGSELARRVSASRNTVSRWVTGKTDIPGTVVAYVGIMLTLKRAMVEK